MSDPYKKAKPDDPILADTWNEMQLDIRNHILTHTHTGGTNEGTLLTGASIDKMSTLQVEKVVAASTLSVSNIDVGAKLQALTDDKLAITGGEIRGALKINSTLRVTGDAAVESSLTVNAKLSVSGALSVSGDLTAGKTLNVTGEAKFGGPVSLANGASIRIASNSSTGSNYAMAAPDAPVRMVWGFVDKDAKIVSGQGFTVVKDGIAFRVTFSTKFVARPCVIVTQQFNGSTLDNAVVSEILEDRCKILTGNAQGVAEFRPFSFVAIGP
jgi:hypothetical protein